MVWQPVAGYGNEREKRKREMIARVPSEIGRRMGSFEKKGCVKKSCERQEREKRKQREKEGTDIERGRWEVRWREELKSTSALHVCIYTSNY